MTVLDAKRHREDLVEELIAEVEAYNPDVDKELLRRAFEYAERAHAGQTRRSGEEFIHHPLGVARVCAELHLDEQTIAAALLHDVIEDTDSDVDGLRSEFGPDVALRVEGVTKLTRISFQSREQDEHPPKATALDVVEEKPHAVLSVRGRFSCTSRRGNTNTRPVH
jgi:(p)ppGpp synthase/HD superfamily hydrolase